jgi:hypothetical protein
VRQFFASMFVLLAVGLAVPAFGTTWDPAVEFSATDNPNGVWAYGWVSYEDFVAGGYTLTFFDTTREWDELNHWGVAEGTEPAVLYNPTDAVHAFGNNVPPHTMALHPGGSDERAIIRWTAPESGTFLILGSFFSDGIPTTDLHVLLNGTSLFDDYLDGAQTKPFSMQVVAVAGDAIDFAVGFGGNGHNSDSTNFCAQIEAVPEPGSVLAVGGVLLGLLRFAARRRR